MSICWNCYWGWPVQVVDVYNAALKQLDGYSDPLEFGPSHIVWSDENFDDGSIDFCLNEAPNQLDYDYSREELAIVAESLRKLKEIPEHVRAYEPNDYDGEHPENFPPAIQMAYRTK